MSEIRDRRQLIRDLKDLKDEGLYGLENDFDKIYNLCSDIDFKYNDYELTDYITEQNFVRNDEVLDELIKQNSSDIDRLRCFIGDTYSSDLYKIDGYGNLANVTSGDMEMLVDELIDIVKDQIKALQASEM